MIYNMPTNIFFLTDNINLPTTVTAPGKECNNGAKYQGLQATTTPAGHREGLTRCKTSVMMVMMEMFASMRQIITVIMMMMVGS